MEHTPVERASGGIAPFVRESVSVPPGAAWQRQLASQRPTSRTCRTTIDAAGLRGTEILYVAATPPMTKGEPVAIVGSTQS